MIKYILTAIVMVVFIHITLNYNIVLGLVGMVSNIGLIILAIEIDIRRVNHG